MEKEHKPSPLFPLLYALTMGLLYAAYDWKLITIIMVGILSIALFLCWCRYKYQFIYLLLLASIFSLGIQLYPSKLKESLPKNGRYTYKVLESKRSISGKNHYHIRFIDSNHKTKETLLYTDSLTLLKEGSIVSSNLSFDGITSSYPSYFMDYSYYLRSQGISYKAWAKENIIIDKGKVKSHQTTLSIHHYLNKIWHNKRFTKEHEAFIQALLMGNKSYLTTEVKSHFSHLGISHVLAMSGLHLSILWGIVVSMLYPLLFFSKTKPLAYIIAWIVCSLFMQSINASISLQRAMWMISIGIIYILVQRQSSPIHIWTIAVMVMLIIAPQIITSIGFQLSITAVLGILWFAPYILDIWHPKQKLLLWVWQVSAASIGAQIGTLPLILYYFHQWNPLALIWNLVAIPVVTIQIGLGLIQLISHSFPFIENIIIYLANHITHIFFTFCRQTDQLFPIAIHDLYLSPKTFTMMTITIIAMSSSLRKKHLHQTIMVLIVSWVSILPISPEPTHFIWKNSRYEKWYLMINDSEVRLWVHPTPQHPHSQEYIKIVKPIIDYYHIPFHGYPNIIIDSTSVEKKKAIHSKGLLCIIKGKYGSQQQLYIKTQRRDRWTEIEHYKLLKSAGDLIISPTIGEQMGHYIQDYKKDKIP